MFFADSECLRLNKEIAYKGVIGRRRRDFCIDFINRKKTVIREIEQNMVAQIQDNNEAITCCKGCSSCCVAYIEASLGECEAIVYYLYQDEKALSIFLKQYPKWRADINDYGDLYKRCEQVLSEIRYSKEGEETRQNLADALFLYKIQNISCPFLHDRICTIHEVRPFTCASHYVTTPADWCSPLSPGQPKVYKASIAGDQFDQQFYFGSMNKPEILFMPMAVYRILKCGFTYLADTINLESLRDDALKDLEVVAAMQQYFK